MCWISQTGSLPWRMKLPAVPRTVSACQRGQKKTRGVKKELVPAQVRDEEAQRPVVSRGQLLEEVPDPEDDSVELDTRPPLLDRRGALKLVHLLHDHLLALFGQADQVVVVAVQDQRLWQLQAEAARQCVFAVVQASGRQGGGIWTRG